MLDDYFFNKRLKGLFRFLLSFKGKNTLLFKQKLSLYKKLQKNPSLANNLLLCIKEQEKGLRTIQWILVTKFNTDGSTPFIRASSFLDRGKVLTVTFSTLLLTQKNILKNQELYFEEKITFCRDSFRKEISLYQDYEILSKEFSGSFQNIIEQAKKDIQKRKTFPLLLKILGLTFALLFFATTAESDLKQSYQAYEQLLNKEVFPSFKIGFENTKNILRK